MGRYGADLTLLTAGFHLQGKSTYTEKLEVGYRYYDAHGITPKYAFGHGTSSLGNIFFILATLSWMCVGVHNRRTLPSPLCA